MSPQILHHVQKQGRRGRPRKYAQDGTRMKTNSNDPTKKDESVPIEQKPREERSYKDFYPDLDIREPLKIVKLSVSSNTNQQLDIELIDASATSKKIKEEGNKQEEEEEEEKEKGEEEKDKKGEEVVTSEEEEEEEEEEVEERTLKLPTPSFCRIETERINDNVLFERPTNHYIRYREPTETELFDIVEYDMDEQDDIWLGILNKERQKENLGQVSNDLFETIIDQLEKNWFDLVKNLPKKINDEPAFPEDSKCAICDDGECENSNAIVFCDGCNLAVHQDCYGIPYIPEGQWLCRKCMVSPENPVSCIFCPNEGGAFKQTTTNQWGHLICAIWIPEVGLSNSVYMEPIDNIENIPKSRWKLTCYICRCRHQGACIQCDNKHCFVAFHATCARWARLCMRMKLHNNYDGNVSLKAYCDRHTPRDYRELVDVDKNIVAAQRWFASSKRKNSQRLPRRRYVDEEIAEEEQEQEGEEEGEEEEQGASEERDGVIRGQGRGRGRGRGRGGGALIKRLPVLDSSNNNKRQSKKQRRERATMNQLLPTSKAARAHQHQYSAGAPVAPEYIIKKIEDLNCVRQATKLRKKQQLITSICRYWSLKRESRRGAPLLKRLHLEPWTASSSQLKQSEFEKAQKASMTMNLRADIEKVRMLSEQVQKREKQKLERVRKQKAYLEIIFYPVEYIIRPILEQLIELDKKELFRYPVTPELASDYYDIIKSPMSFSDILEKLYGHIYTTLDEFEFDMTLIWTNSMLYNKVETLYYKTAQKLQNITNGLMAEARLDFGNMELNHNGILDYVADPDVFSYDTDLSIEQNMNDNETQSVATIDEKTDKDEEHLSISTLENNESNDEDELDNEKEEIQNDKELQNKKEIMDSTNKNKDSNDNNDNNKRVTIKAITTTASASASIALDEKKRAEKNSNTNHTTEKPSRSRITRSNTERNKRTLRSRSVIKEVNHPIKIRRTSEKEFDKNNHDNSKQQQYSKESDKITSHDDSKQQLKESDNTTSQYNSKQQQQQQKEVDKTTSQSQSPAIKKLRSNTPKLRYENGEIVWARVVGFPPHPATIVDPTTERVPPKVLSQAPPAKILVEFFLVRTEHTWGWVDKINIHAFGDPDLDVLMLKTAKKRKGSARVVEVKNGYRHVCELKNIDPDPQLERVFNNHSNKKK